MKKFFLFTLIGVFAIVFADSLRAQAIIPQQTRNESSLRESPSITYRFKIVDEKGEPIIGATIMYKAFWSSVGTITDLDGNATLVVDDTKPTFIISYIGYKTVEITVSGMNQITIVIKEDTEVLDK